MSSSSSVNSAKVIPENDDAEETQSNNTSVLDTTYFSYPPKSIQDSTWIRRKAPCCKDGQETTPRSTPATTTATRPGPITIEDLQQWTFDPLLYHREELICVFPLLMTTHYGFDVLYNIPHDTLTHFSTAVMHHYKDVSYHNWFHTISVVHYTFMLLLQNNKVCGKCHHGGAAATWLYDRDIFAVLLAAFIHDLDHTGHNNEYENKTNSMLSQKYQQDSVLEHNSIDVTWNDIFSRPQCNILHAFETQDPTLMTTQTVHDADDDHAEDSTFSMKDWITAMVLRTDFAKYHGNFVQLLQQRKADAEAAEPTDEDVPCRAYFDKRNTEHRLLLCQALLKAADIANASLVDFHAVLDWAMRVSIEFKNQVDDERQLLLHSRRSSSLTFRSSHTSSTDDDDNDDDDEDPESTKPNFMDVHNEYEVAINQIGFIKYCVLPFYTALSHVVPQTQRLLPTITNNLNQYEQYVTYVDMRTRENRNRTTTVKTAATNCDHPPEKD